MFKKITPTLVICLICTLLLLPLLMTQGKPLAAETAADDESDEYHGNLDEKTKKQLKQCDLNLETMELCMRCAKITKSTIVYPLCCANEDSVKDWCHDYIYFGGSD